MSAAVAIAVLLVTACGPSTKSTTAPPPDLETPPADAATAAKPEPSTDARAAVAAPENARERCALLVDHMLNVAIGEQPEDSRPQLHDAMAGERDRLIDECTAGDLTPAEYRCAMAAQSSDEMQQCGE